MTIERTIDIPANRHIVLDLPSSFPVGQAYVEIKTRAADKNSGKSKIDVEKLKEFYASEAYLSSCNEFDSMSNDALEGIRELTKNDVW
jgi:hypothetical protein